MSETGPYKESNFKKCKNMHFRKSDMISTLVIKLLWVVNCQSFKFDYQFCNFVVEIVPMGFKVNTKQLK